MNQNDNRGYYDSNSNYNPNYNQNYNPNYNQNYNPNYNMNFDPYGEQTAYFQGSAAERKMIVNDIMVRTYLFMFGVLVLSGLSAYLTYSTDLVYTVFSSNSNLFVFLGLEIATVLAANYALRHNKVVLSAVMLVAYSIINGITLSFIFVCYAYTSIAGIFFIAAGMFAALSVYGAVTKKDLTMLGRIGYMGLVGVILLSLGNIFIFKSDGLFLGIGVLGLALFIGITAYDTKTIKQMAETCSPEEKNTVAMFGALNLYLDFINIFLYLLRLFGSRD